MGFRFCFPRFIMRFLPTAILSVFAYMLAPSLEAVVA
jgi:hypothetical protein